MKESDRLNIHGSAFFVQGRVGTRKTYLLSLLRDMVEQEGLLVQMTATTGIAAALHEGGRTLHNLLGFVIHDNKDMQSTELQTLSKCRIRSQRSELVQKNDLLVPYKA